MYVTRFLVGLAVGVSVLAFTSCGSVAGLQANRTHQFMPQSAYIQNPVNDAEILPLEAEGVRELALSVQPDLQEVSEWSSDYDVQQAIEQFKSDKIQSIIERAESYLGVRYRYGGTSRNGIDCSSFVQKALQDFYPEFPRVSHAQAQRGKRIAKHELAIGDLVYFATRGRGRVSHVGIVHHFDEENNPHFIHASSSQGVSITSLRNSYWGARYLFAKRILTDDVLGVNEWNEESNYDEVDEVEDSIVVYNSSEKLEEIAGSVSR